MTPPRLHTCMLCEAICGIQVEVDGDRAVSIRGDRDDPFSRGHICPKAAALDDIRTDPDRVLSPLRRIGDRHEAVTWDRALDEAAGRIVELQEKYGRHAVALYLGNPTVHTYAGFLYALLFSKVLRSRSRFSATSVDQLPQMLASLTLFGHQALLPVPDVDRTDFFLILGANPLVSNGSLMTAPGIGARIAAVRARGGKVVVVDPRRTETAAVADAHHFIRPGADALLLLAMIHVLFAEGRTRLGRLGPFVDGLDALERAARSYSPEAVAPATGIAADAIRGLARDFAAAPRAVCYGRVGICTQEFGGLASWLVLALNVVTGNLDAPGGAMFTTPAVDVVGIAAKTGDRGHFARWKSRVRGLPEFGGELPIAALAEEIETPGEGQIRALVTFAGNPVLSAPNGPRLERALAKLDFMVSIDIYKNETTRHAHLILPTAFGLERDHFDVVLNALAVRNTARYVPAIFAPAGETREDWRILADLAYGIAKRRRRGSAGASAFAGPTAALLRRLGPRRVLDLLLRAGPHRLSLRKLEKAPHGIDLGPLEPVLPRRLCTPRKRIDVAPALYLDELPRLARKMADGPADGAARAAGLGLELELELVGRRQLRSNNSWMHNSLRLVKGPARCTLLMHPDDAAKRGLANGAAVRVRSSVGAVTATLEVSADVVRGVVSLPHGWGHDRAGTDLRVARAHAGASINDLTEELRLDALSGNASFSGVPVDVVADVAG